MSINKSKDKSRPIRNIEKWSDIIAKLNLDVSKPVNYITADQIKQTSNREPRLMAKMDKTEDLPKVFRDNNLFVLPISRREYAIVKGVGYHQSEPITEKPIIHNTQIAFPVSALDRKSESIYLEYASSSGLLKKLSGEDNLIPILRGRTTTPIFSFNVNDTKLTVNKAQIEIDAGFESPTQMLLFEAKINLPSSFNIRQLYYPYRTFSAALGQKVKKKVRNFFFCFRPKLNLYLFWEYEFNPSDNFESINLIQCKQYQVKVYKVPSIKQFRNVPVRKGIDIPQADDVNKIIQFPVKVFEGYDSAKKMRGIFGLVARQITYYGQASETLGLVKRHRDKYEVTDIAERYLKLPAEKKSNLICKLLLEFPIINEIFVDISSDRSKVITKQDIIDLLKNKSNLTGHTLVRRARTIRSWFRWIRNNLGIVEVDRNGNIRVSRQLTLE